MQNGNNEGQSIIVVFDPDGLSGKIIEYYQRYLKRKGL